MLSVQITVTGLEASINVFRKLDAKMGQGLMERVGSTIRLQTLRRFFREVDPDGKKWRPLAPSTIARKGSSGILKDTGLLQGSINYVANPTTAIIGTGVFYGPYHQFGGTRAGWPNGCPPRRSFLGINSKDVAELEQVISAYLGV